jgi:hypothetical protein
MSHTPPAAPDPETSTAPAADRHAGSAPAGPIGSRADVPTDAPARYAKQLVSHLGRKVEFTGDATSSTATIGNATARIVVGDGVLTLLATGRDEPSVALVEQVLGSHLERFGRRGELTVTWIRTTGATPATTAPPEDLA